jgi:hypothetical protein
MANKANYALLTDSDKVKVNAAIIEGLESDPKGFGKSFMAEVAKQKGGEQKDKFQTVLDAVRNDLATKVDSLPKTTENGLSASTNLREQSTLLRSARDYAAPADVARALKNGETFILSGDRSRGNETNKHVEPTDKESALNIMKETISKLQAKSVGHALNDKGISISDSTVTAHLPAKSGERSLG